MKEWENKSLIKPILNLFWAACQIWGAPSDIFFDDDLASDLEK